MKPRFVTCPPEALIKPECNRHISGLALNAVGHRTARGTVQSPLLGIVDNDGHCVVPRMVDKWSGSRLFMAEHEDNLGGNVCPTCFSSVQSQVDVAPPSATTAQPFTKLLARPVAFFAFISWKLVASALNLGLPR
jgi:hypothetical protein